MNPGSELTRRAPFGIKANDEFQPPSATYNPRRLLCRLRLDQPRYAASGFLSCVPRGRREPQLFRCHRQLCYALSEWRGETIWIGDTIFRRRPPFAAELFHADGRPARNL